MRNRAANFLLTHANFENGASLTKHPLIQLFIILCIIYLTYQTIIKSLGVIYYCLVFQITGIILCFCKLTSLCNKYTSLGAEKERNAVSIWLNFIATIWHGYEVVGLVDKIPDEPCIFVFYHESTIVDLLYFGIKYHKAYPSRNLYIIGGNRVSGKFWCPRWSRLLEAFNIYSATCNECVDVLSEGNDLCILPGGCNYYGERDYYRVNWGKRIGFALIAVMAKAPIIPIFTKNIQEAFCTLNIFKPFVNAASVSPMIQVISGGLPVKLTTYVDDVIHYDNLSTPSELADKTAACLKRCIEEYQTIPSSKTNALGERFSGCKCKIQTKNLRIGKIAGQDTEI